MQYLTEIIWLITWPILIWISYKLSIFAVTKLEKKES